MTRLLWHSNAPWAATGYGEQTRLFAPLVNEHYDVVISAFYGLEGAPHTWNGIPILPGYGGLYGDEYVVQHAKRVFGGDPRDGLVFTLMDVWVLNPHWIQQVNGVCWVPVDHDPPPPAVVEFLMKADCVPIAMSKFGEAMIGRLDPLYVPHGVDTETFKPLDRKACREAAGVSEDAFIVGMVAANKGRPSRKSYPEALIAFAKFAEKHDNAYLYLHTMVSGGPGGGINLASLISAYGLEQRVMICDQYRTLFDPHSDREMAKIFNTFDVLLNPSMGEGFGIPVLEAQACGVPAIVTDFSAMSEVCGAGWKVQSQESWTGQESLMRIPIIADIVDALEESYQLSAARKERLGKLARRHAMHYDHRRVCKKYMLPALKTATDRFEKRRPVRIPPRLKAAA